MVVVIIEIKIPNQMLIIVLENQWINITLKSSCAKKEYKELTELWISYFCLKKYIIYSLKKLKYWMVSQITGYNIHLRKAET